LQRNKHENLHANGTLIFLLTTRILVSRGYHDVQNRKKNVLFPYKNTLRNLQKRIIKPNWEIICKIHFSINHQVDKYFRWRLVK